MKLNVLFFVLEEVLPTKEFKKEGREELLVGGKMVNKRKMVELPKPKLKGSLALEEAFLKRRTTRFFQEKDIDLKVISQLLWALQGITYVEDREDEVTIYHRAAPSAGRSFPLEVYMVTPTGFYYYLPQDHRLEQISDEDLRAHLSEAAISRPNQEAIRTVPLTIVLAADNTRALNATPIMENAVRYVHLEAGHAVQNLLLQAASLDLGVCTLTSYQIATVYQALGLPRDHRPIYLLPVGYPASEPSE